MTISGAIGFVLENIPAILLVLALLLASLGLGGDTRAGRFLDWVMLLPIGFTLLWAALYHLAFPTLAARYIGWQPSPFQFEVGVADLGMGVAACLAFRGSLAFKGAVIWIVAISLLGDAVGHVRQMLAAGNFAPGNAGAVFWTDIITPLLAIALWLAARRDQPRNGSRSASRNGWPGAV